MTKHIYLFAALLLCMLASCAGQQNGSVDNQSGSELQAPGSLIQSHNPIVNDAAIPTDHLLPWEQLNADGFVDPATARMSSAINENSEFWRGADAFETAGTTSPFGQALNVQSGSAGGFGRSSATYRIPLSGENPATLSTDINLYLRSDGSTSEFYIGIANYATGRWDFFGGFTDGRIRLPVDEAASGDYISGLGNAFISIVAYNGSNFDIVGISLNQFDVGDIFAPPVSGGLTLTPVAGGLELQWNSVLAADLAGYRIHWSKNSFISAGAAGVQTLNYLEGDTRHVLTGLSGSVFVAVSAVDLNGNASAASTLQSAIVTPGSAPVVEMTTDSASGLTGSMIQLAASGADTYDWDLDGDGVFEITDDNTGSQFADTGKAGIIRPAVRASTDGGTRVALGAVSLIIAANLPPVAVLSADQSSGVRWPGDAAFSPELSAAGTTDEDPAGLLYAFDQSGNGNYSAGQPSVQYSAAYTERGSYLASVRVTDNAGLVAHAYTLVTLRLATDWSSNYITFDDPPASEYVGTLDSAMVDGHPAMVFTHSDQGLFYVRANDPEGRSWPAPLLLDASLGTGKGSSLSVIDGKPAVAFCRIDQLCYIRAATSTGDTLSDWSNPVVVVVDDSPTVWAEQCSLAEVAGRPAIAFRDGFNNYDAFYVRADNATGDLTADWTNPYVLIEGCSISSLVRIQLIVSSGNPAVCIASTNQMLFERSTSATGDSAGDWAAIAFNLCDQSSTLEDSGLSLTLIAGNPAVAWFDRANTPYKLRYRRSNTASGATAGDWGASLVLDEGVDTQFVGDHCSLAEVNGRPAVSYQRPWVHGSTLFFIRARDSTGASWGSKQLADGGIGDYPGYDSHLVGSKGWAGIAHYDGLIAGNVIYFSSVNLD